MSCKAKHVHSQPGYQARNYKKVEVKCFHCGKIFSKKPSDIKLKKWLFCSVECMGVFYRESGRFAGENNGAWNGGDISYYGANWLGQRELARERDCYKCMDCGISELEYGRELSVHHIKKFRDFNGDWQSANRLENLLSVCEPCHRKRHKFDCGRGRSKSS